MSEVNVGPTVTQYTLKPAEGIKLSKITALQNDLALALASPTIRIEAPIPGRSLVGIEVGNKAPELIMDIPEQEWDEDTTHTLDLTEYFYDLDGDKLYYLFSESSDNSNIILEKIEGGVAHFKSKKDWSGEDWIIFRVTDGLNVVYSNNITLRVLPVNDAPVILGDIEVINMYEDGVYELILEGLVYDPDSELEYSFENTSHITLQLSEDLFSISIIPKENWYGEEEVEIIVNDEEFQVELKFIVKVNSVNDAPIIEDIEEQFVLAGDTLSFSVFASDIEGDEITYEINDSRFVSDENNFEELLNKQVKWKIK